MRIGFTLAAALGAAMIALAPAPAVAQQMQSDQERAYTKVKEGRAMPLPQIERSVVPKMRGYQYLGPELRGNVYRLKFVRDGRVVWVDVDPRTGRIVGRSGR